jgi:ribosomal protein S1
MGYDKLKIAIGDLLRLCGWLGRTVRRKSVESEYEGVINQAINEFNDNFESPIMPKCELQWVDSGNQQSIIEEGKAIVCLEFDNKDHDLNFYNATYSFVKSGFLSKAKPFVKQVTAKAIDLLSTRVILRNYRRTVLRVFNNKFRDEQEHVKEVFYRLAETEQKGLYSTLLLPECYHLGEALYTKTPSKEIETEFETFIEWFYDLATREYEAKTSLNFNSNHIRVGVILIAKTSTYEKYGLKPYVSWAKKYAAEHYGAVYLLARGKARGNIAKDLSKELINSGGFDPINKKTQIDVGLENGAKILLTCISLRPNIAALQYQAWESLKRDHHVKTLVNAIVESVSGECVTVSVYGINFDVDREQLSSEKILDCRQFFKADQELLLRIASLDEGQQEVLFSNVGTETDPYLILEAVLRNNSEIEATIIRFAKGNSGFIAKSSDPEIEVFVPRSFSSPSRFSNMESLFHVGQSIRIKLIDFNPDYANMIGEVAGIENPWESARISSYYSNQTLTAIVQEITPNFITCEIEPGVECRIYKSEYSWSKEEQDAAQFKVGQQLKIKIIRINPDRRQMLGSIRQLEVSHTEEFFLDKQGRIVKGHITHIAEGFGLTLMIGENEITAFVPLRDLMWMFCARISDYFSVGDKIETRVMDYLRDSDSLLCSTKARYTNDFSEFVKMAGVGEMVIGKVLNIFKDVARVQIEKGSIVVQGYIHKSQISRIAFLTDDDIKNYIANGNKYSFLVRRFDAKNQIIELSRRRLLNINAAEMTYDTEVQGTISLITRDKSFFYSENCEGFISIGRENLYVGQAVQVRPINLATHEYQISEDA